MNRIKSSVLLLTLLVIVACSGERSKISTGDSDYFDLASLLNDQIKYLTQTDAKLQKELTAQGANETLTIDPDSVKGWERQLKLFFEADINKIGYDGEYYQEQLPVINGLSKKIFAAKNQKHPVKVLECTYEGENLKEVRVSIKESNTVYEMTKEMSLHFNAEEHLIGFNIKGGESMAVKEDLNYSIVGTILY
ncbi:hypothetical protein [Roseivirga misakiensis]|uniref:DUF4252 domain-containing protein n=1 Tax=Roseivirga misakiensis TaxID=1563681 RepID=A0A1E5T6K3_9BACT|nr:hypothetical protein [Roseivirga misakiensis]OEK06976.1 hypothetical protein BFP71_04780 [Roseivirga misakiensis]